MSLAQNPVLLTYHSVSEGRSPLRISPALFAAQMAWLAANARVIPLAELVELLRQERPLPPRTVVLTFDDAFADFHTSAAPVLRRLGFPATVFVPTAYCGGWNNWPGQPDWVEKQPLLTWEQVRALADQQVEFGAHSRTHPVLTELNSAQAEQEIVGSKHDLESATGKPVQFFCYPFGRFNPAVREIVQRSFRGACATGAGIVARTANLFALPRVDAHYLRSEFVFSSLFTRRFQSYVWGRRMIRRLRGQPEGYVSNGGAST
jgi:peptidoglycan/xylan/chitin deacetylase (PgdA/CDA1 family)